MIRLEDVENKQEVLHDFFIWLFDDDRVKDKSISLHNEIDLSLCHDYIDANIYYPHQIKAFFDSTPMQRLSRISHLGLVVNENPNMYHNRLEHSKGVYYRKLEELFYNFQNSEWVKYIENNNFKLYLIADLIKMAGHDIGHLPYSHAMEEQLLGKRGAHEDIGKRIMLELPEIQSILSSISSELPKIMEELYNSKVLNFYEHDESNYDNDRLDFLTRDSLYNGFFTYLPVQKYESICIKTDENGVPICNSDCSIIEDNSGNSYIDVYDFSSLHEIEEMLIFREEQYKKIYMSPKVQSLERCIKNFVEAFLETDSEVGKSLRNYFINLKSKSIEEMDLDLFIKFDEIDLYSELLDIAEFHENPNIRDLATMIIPRMVSFLNIIYSHLQVYDKTIKYSDSDKKFLQKVKRVITSDSQLSINLRNKNYLRDNIIFLPNDASLFLENQEQLVSSYNYTLSSYKKSNPIYIRDFSGKIYELSKHPNRQYDWNNKKYTLQSKFIYLPYLRFKNVSENIIEKIKNSYGDFSSNCMTSPKNKKTQVNMQPLQVGHKMEDVFLEL